MKKKIKLAVWGGGLNSAVGLAHFSAVSLAAKYSLHAVYSSRNLNIRNETAEAWGLQRGQVCHSEEEFLDKATEADAAIVLTPSPRHLEHLLSLLGKVETIVCEKTIVTSSGEGEILRKAVSDSTSQIVPMFNYTAYSQIRHLRHLVMGQFLGKVLSFSIRMPQETFLLRDDRGEPISVQDWRTRDGEISGVSLDLGSHVFHLLEFLIGRSPSRVCAQGSHFGLQGDVLDVVQALVQFDYGPIGTVEYGKIHLGNRNGLSLEVFGSERSARWVQTVPDSITISDNKGTLGTLDKLSPSFRNGPWAKYERFKPGHPTGFVEALANFYLDVAEGHTTANSEVCQPDESLPSLESALKNIEFLALTERSITSQRWEEFLG